ADAGLIAKIEFTYRDSGTPDGNDTGTGTTGDLIQVTVKTHITNETGTTWGIARTTYYRYFKNADTTGDDHQLKMILRPEHAQRAVDAPLTPLSAMDAQIDDYATYLFEYDNAGSARVTKMTPAAGGGGCGGCGGGGGLDVGTYEFSYATQVNT